MDWRRERAYGLNVVSFRYSARHGGLVVEAVGGASGLKLGCELVRVRVRYGELGVTLAGASCRRVSALACCASAGCGRLIIGESRTVFSR